MVEMVICRKNWLHSKKELIVIHQYLDKSLVPLKSEISIPVNPESSVVVQNAPSSIICFSISPFKSRILYPFVEEFNSWHSSVFVMLTYFNMLFSYNLVLPLCALIMSTRKFESGYSKRKQHKKVEQLIKSQEGALDKFFSGSKQKHNDDVVLEEKFNKNDIDNNTIEKHHCLVNEEIYIEYDVKNERNINEKISEPFSFDISDPANWENMNQNLRDLIIMKGPVRDNDLFKNDEVQTQLAHDGANDWKNIGAKLRTHEVSYDHITNLSRWIEMEIRFQKEQTIDKSLQEQINKDREHWRQVLLRIISVVRTLA
ncbi:uncharacterized protein LOC111390225 [Olea europaea var. sylvestris]|uniref:uncharacterized protein LOC111390225 n=1 Tax=Olea europaea var. sylvestris TaxID=158386 RepID=UPI000C1CD9DA|nr:uncharacterized protein LOC111390225 [Olea europaea var. sylvestris]